MSVQYRCDQCDHTQDVLSRSRIYQWDGDNDLYPIHWNGWCQACSKVVVVEYVPSLEALERELALVERDAPYEERLFTVAYDQKAEIQQVQNYIRWRKSRIAPSRCFECGGHDLITMEQRYADFPCPHCPGILRCYLEIVMGSHAYDSDVYSTEGVLLRKGAGLISCFSRVVLPSPTDRGPA